MEPQQSSQSTFHRPPHSRLHSIFPPAQSHLAQHRTANSTPVSSPSGLFSPSMPRPNMTFPSQPGSETATPGGLNSPYLHPLQGHKVRETHKANVEHDGTTGRKHINNYEIIEELGRGVHGKVKLARNVETGEFVAIKIVPRFSKKRRLGKVMAMSTRDKSKKEIAILKKIRHPNVVALLEVIDDPELKKIYMVLEHVELGEVVWRKKGLPHICEYERRRIEREKRGAKSTPEEERFERALLQRQAAKAAAQRESLRARAQKPSGDHWNLEYGPADDEELEAHVGSLGREDSDLSVVRPALSNSGSLAGSRATSRAPSRSQSGKSLSRFAEPDVVHDDEDLETPGALPIKGKAGSSTALDGTMYGAYADDPSLQGRSPSMADSLMSHISSFDFNRVQDPFVDDYSYVPCFTIEQARSTFRDTVLGLEYLHYEGVVHRDIKPANLLWTKDKRTKIADFGVSYFGRPVRDGEPDDTISESEARDFDDDFELAKTVGTPAFFAPELCATDLYDSPPGKQPKVTEQIDVWSLGVTLYCLIYARLPFLAEDEWQMFKKIANEEVYIPDRRLRPVDPATKPNEKSLYTRLNKPPYRNDDELAYEDIEPELQDLLRKMLTKDPEKRIRLRDVKRHPWVMHGVDMRSWIDDTDPSRRASGKRIQVDEKDMARAVVPLSLMERARSVVKKAVGKVMHPRGDRTDSVSSRRRATSSAASSAGDITSLITPHLRDSRRKSLRPDDYFTGASQQPGGHPLTHSVLASPETESPPVSSPANQPSPPPGGHPPRRPLELLSSLTGRDDGSRRRQSDSPHRGLLPRHGQSRSITNAFLTLTPNPMETLIAQSAAPFLDSSTDDPSRALRKARDTKPHVDEPGRARSVDRGLFVSEDKRAEARVSLSTAVAPGNVHFAAQPHPARPAEPREDGSAEQQDASTVVPPAPGSPGESGQFKPDPNMHDTDDHGLLRSEKQPATDQGIEALLNKPSTPEPMDPALVPCPPSPDDETLPPLPPSRGDTATGPSSSSTSMGALTTPMPSPSESVSPIYGLNNQMTKEVADRMLAFQSDPSLPALLSSTSSVSADPEGEFLGHPGFVGRSSVVVETTDSLTPPAFAKEPMSGFPLEAHDLEGAVPVKLDNSTVFAGTPASRRFSIARRWSRCQPEDDDNDSESDSDEGLTMARRKKKPSESPASAAAGASPQRDMQGQVHGVERLVRNARRRDTTASMDSTETAKKMFVDDE
ncbi:hypothetical protein VTH82DRAFT_296 [Thermothelomyces myriococcoides]